MTDFVPANALAVPEIWSGAVIWLRTVESELKRHVEGVLAQGFRQRVFNLLSTLGNDPKGPLETALRTALLDASPPLTLYRLASATGVSERSFRRLWRKAGFPGRSEALIDWGLLVRVVSERKERESLSRCCFRLGVDPWRIQRAANRRAGASAGKLSQEHLLRAVKAWAG